MGKLNELVSAFNDMVQGVNAQIAAGQDAATIKSEMEDVRDQAINDVAALRNEAETFRNQAEAIQQGDISGTHVDFASVKVAGSFVYHPGNKPTKATVGLPEVDNTSDANKPISTAQANKNTEQDEALVNAVAAIDAKIAKNRTLALAAL